MRKRTHFQIARLSVENTKHPDLPMEYGFLYKWAFLLGAILPDLTITQFKHRHFYEKSSDYVFDKLYKIEGKQEKGIFDAIRLGEMVHYLCDFCCYAHSGGKIGSISEHLTYEKRIHQYVINNYKKLQKSVSDSTADEYYGKAIEQIKNELADYRNMVPGYQLDISKSMRITTIVYFGILLKQFECNRTTADLNMRGEMIRQSPYIL